MKSSAHNDKNLIYIGAVLVSFLIFLIFIQNQNFLAEEEQTSGFFFYAAVAAGLMIFLVYLVSNRKPHKKSSRKG